MTTPLSDADLKQIWARWEKGIETYDDLVAAGDDIPHLLAEVDRLRARVARLEGVLRDVEWVEPEPTPRAETYCLWCGAVCDGHAPDCELAAALADAHE